MTTGKPSKWDFERTDYDFLVKFADPALVVEAIEKSGLVSDPVKQYPKNDDDSSDLSLLASQFVWMHRFVLNEATAQPSTSSDHID